MTTAKKLDLNYPVLTSVTSKKSQSQKKIHPLLKESQDIFEQMGWNELPDEIKLVIAIDLVGFRDELAGLYSTKDPRVLARRKSIYFWVNQFMNGNCSVATAMHSLRVISLV